jgi:BirA family biotin operon repressor/biotin-[acetyl-CoA-carboxylase] ligase
LTSPLPLPDDIVEALARAAARLGRFGRQAVYYASVESTNDIAHRLASAGAAEGTIVMAEAQSAGRGRLGRTWFSPPGAGLYLSVVCRPDLTAGGAAPAPEWPVRPLASRLTLVAGVALAEGIGASTGLPVAIKWPNDIVIGPRKVCGILAEASTSGGDLPYVVLGLGINLRAAGYPPEIAGRATSLEAELGRAIDRGAVLVEVLAALAARYDDLRACRFDAILSRWRELAPASAGAAVEWTSPSGVRRGATAGIDDTGALLVAAGGHVERIIAGEIRWL